jgi:hypothetical protein
MLLLHRSDIANDLAAPKPYPGCQLPKEQLRKDRALFTEELVSLVAPKDSCSCLYVTTAFSLHCVPIGQYAQ